MAISWQKISIPFIAGRDAKPDDFALKPPFLQECIDAEFEGPGALTTRKPFAALTDSSSIANIKRLVEYDNELIAFTTTGIWSYSSNDNNFYQVATYYAVKTEEEPAFVSPAEQYDCDKVEDLSNGVTWYTWTENTNGTVTSYLAAIDTTTGTVLLAPTSLGSNVVRPRLTYATSRTVLTAYNTSTTRQVGQSLNGASASSTTISFTDLITGTAGEYDVIVVGTTLVVAATDTGNTSYTVSTFNSSTLAQTDTANPARVSDGAIAIAYDTNTPMFAVARLVVSGGDVMIDMLDSALDDSSVNINVGEYSDTPKQLSALFKDTQDSSQYRCYVFYDESGRIDYGWADTGGTGGGTSGTVFRRGVNDIVSHPFLYNNDIYVWIGYEGVSAAGGIQSQIQNSYFLYNYDGTLVAKAVTQSAGGEPVTDGHLPGVQSLGSNQYSFCGLTRRKILLGNAGRDYSARSPVNITATFDSNDARRTAVLGKTLYISGGQVGQFDGRGYCELGFHTYPADLSLVDADDTGEVPQGTQTYKATYSWYNAKGEFERSTTATSEDIASTTASTGSDITISTQPLHHTEKKNTNGNPAIEYWRTQVDPPFGAPLYLATATDPSTNTTDNTYISSVVNATTTTFRDALSDANLSIRELYPEAGGTLANLAPPPATVIYATQDRLILGGIAGFPHRVMYSKLRNQGELAAFNDALYIDLPATGGDIEAISELNEILVVFKENAIYMLPGVGYDNAGGGNNYGPARLVSSDIGAVSAETVAITPRGIVFKSNKGWYLLNQGWQVSYIGGPISDYDSATYDSVVVLEDQHQVRCCNGSQWLVWDYLVDQWSEWSVTDGGNHSIIYDGTHHYAADNDTVKEQQADWTGNTDAFGLDIETPWLTFADLQGFQRVKEMKVLLRWAGASAMKLRTRIAYDYSQSFTDDSTIDLTAASTNDPDNIIIRPSRQKCQAMKIRLSARNTGDTDFPTDAGIDLLGLVFKVGMKKGFFNNFPVANKEGF